MLVTLVFLPINRYSIYGVISSKEGKIILSFFFFFSYLLLFSSLFYLFFILAFSIDKKKPPLSFIHAPQQLSLRMFKRLITLTFLVSLASACEPLCRHAISQAFADRYIPVIHLAVTDLHEALNTNLYNITIPSKLLDVVPEKELQDGIRNTVQDGLDDFTMQSTGDILQEGIHQTIFSGDEPFKGDCNNPKRLDRKKPKEDEEWTREECAKMDYICGNPPSICHFLDMIKGRIVVYLRAHLKEQTQFGSGLLFQNLAPNMKQAVHSTMIRYGAGSLLTDADIMAYVNNIISNTIRVLDVWSHTTVQDICAKPEDQAVCGGWDDVVIPEILRWP
ncbi:hypothetical protein BDB00DRAFT_863164 [Zychaea mexicana]|uniref:uncharacterized protein n=1 Tax=Zychaea mexicana TaxID=64656 RepID=UPI0022FE0061|nr:uncharacterized protein BDB00DRAFT_863164 [Zychaea mexicana]KAI9469312.1 hypothetical protein BDB00DRAFT_863164 [Zychaea mexicana]